MNDLLRTWLDGLLDGLPPGQIAPHSRLGTALLERVVEQLEDYTPAPACIELRQSLAAGEASPAPESTLGRHAARCTSCALALLELRGAAPGLLDVEQVELLLWITEPVRAFQLEVHAELASVAAAHRSVHPGYSAMELALMAHREHSSVAQAQARVHQVLVGSYQGASGLSYGYAERGVDDAGSAGSGTTDGPATRVATGTRGVGEFEAGSSSEQPTASIEPEISGLHLVVLGPPELSLSSPPALGSLVEACGRARVPILLLPSGSEDLVERVLSTAEQVRDTVGTVWGWDECFLEPTALLLRPDARRGSKAWQLGLGGGQEADILTIVSDLEHLVAHGEPEVSSLESTLWSGSARPFWLPEAGRVFLARFGEQRDDPGRSSTAWSVHAPWVLGHAEPMADPESHPSEPELSGLEALLDSTERAPVFLVAPVGGGKSSLLRRWLDLRRSASPEAVLVSRFYSDEPASSVSEALLSLWAELAGASGVAFLAPRGRLAIRDGFRTLLEACGREHRVVLVLDGLEDLNPGLDDLGWIPPRLPDGVTLLTAVSSGSPASARMLDSLLREGSGRLMELAPVQSLERRRTLASAYLERQGASLPASRLELALHFEGSGNPLFLEVLLGSMLVLEASGWLDSGGDLAPGTTPESCFDACLLALERSLEPETLAILRGQLAQLVDEPTGVVLEPLSALRPFTRRLEGRTRLLHPSLRNVARRWCVWA